MSCVVDSVGFWMVGCSGVVLFALFNCWFGLAVWLIDDVGEFCFLLVIVYGCLMCLLAVLVCLAVGLFCWVALCVV